MSSEKEEQRFDNVQITNIVENTIIEGHDTVKMQLERDQRLLTEYGTSIIFQVYRLDLQAETLEKLQGRKLAEIKVDSDFVSEVDTVAVVKNKVRSLLKEKAPMRITDQAPAALTIEEVDHLTLYFNGHPLQDGTVFYTDNPIMLPAWIQILLHHCKSEEVIQLINKLQKQS